MVEVVDPVGVVNAELGVVMLCAVWGSDTTGKIGGAGLPDEVAEAAVRRFCQVSGPVAYQASV
jgi:hypothetical protein